MELPLTFSLTAEVWSAALVFARVGAMVATLPAFGETMAPPRVRLMIALALTVALTPLVGLEAQAVPAPVLMTGLILVEVLTGLAAGFASRFILSAVQVAANVIALQTGLSFAMSVDPAQGGQGAIVSSFLSLLALVLIFATDLHHVLIGSIKHSYVLFPIGQVPSVADFAQWAIRLSAAAIALGVQMSAPFLVFGIVFQIAAGVIARLMPQVQIFFLSVPLSILAGLIILIFSLGAMMMLFLDAFSGHIAPMAGQ